MKKNKYIILAVMWSIFQAASLALISKAYDIKEFAVFTASIVCFVICLVEVISNMSNHLHGLKK